MIIGSLYSIRFSRKLHSDLYFPCVGCRPTPYFYKSAASSVVVPTVPTSSHLATSLRKDALGTTVSRKTRVGISRAGEWRIATPLDHTPHIHSYHVGKRENLSRSRWETALPQLTTLGYSSGEKDSLRLTFVILVQLSCVRYNPH